MDIGNNYQATTNYTPSTPGVQPSGPVVTTGVPSAVPVEVDQGSLSGPGAAGEMPYDAGELATQILGGASGTDWGALTDSVQAANLSVTVTAILVLLIEVMSQMKQDAREDAFTQAQATLEAGLLAAQKQMDAAEDTLAAATLQAGVQIAMGAVQVLGGAYQMKQISGFQSASAVNARNPFNDPLDFSQLSASLQAQTQLLNGVTSLSNNIANLVAAGMTYDASIAQAESQQARADADYQQALGQAAQAFMQQLADAIKSFLSGMESVDQAQHKATGAIYNC